MKTSLVLIASALAGGLGYDLSDPGTSPTESAAAFARMKLLAGEWEADTHMGKARTTYELIAGGTTLVERESAENMPVMLTVYYLDGDRLLLTHYCMAGNQPRMEAKSFHPETGEVSFRFLDATNLKSAADGHMHNATIRIVDKDHMVTEWEFFENGSKKMAESSKYTRIR